jgi:hypothetical protein
MRSLALGVLLLTAGVARADMGTFVLGSGHDSCGRLIATIGSAPPGSYKTMNTGSGVFISEYKQYQEWLMGFVSGFNGAHANQIEQQVKSIDLAGMDLWMRNWCNQHPRRTVFEGASAFIDEMRINPASAAGGRAP